MWHSIRTGVVLLEHDDGGEVVVVGDASNDEVIEF
jgi:hypothetical protein